VPKNFGRCVEILESEVANILDIEIEPIVIKLTNEARRIRFLNVNNDLLRKELSRLVALISCDIKRSGSDKNGIYPQRKGPNDSDLFAMLNEKWSVQKGSCALCGVEIPLETKNKLLQMSRDRIDSLDKSYESYNIQITHCGCNLAKNDVSMEEWREYVTLLRSFSG
jgi:hypothetical protein